MAKKGGGRLISSAGLVNYYDSEDRRAVHINPLIVFALAIGIGVAIFILNAFY
ncbi:MAG: preprotein translocase subunit Sec61beta [Methanomicrobiales archaeon]|nr:preprotein translocase subunit Sec61beta [Methanomicrobiales archaeon]